MFANYTRRQWLQYGSAGLMGLTLPGFLRAAAAAEEQHGSAPILPKKLRACIIVFYYGGPSHLDTYDPKPNAPAEVRGEFKAIQTSVPGIHVSEHLSQMSQRMHKVAVIRSLHHTNRLHDSASTETLTGRQSPVGDREEFSPIEQFFPSYGAALSYAWREQDLDVPHAALPFMFHNVIDVPCQGGGFLGSTYDPLRIEVDPESRVYRTGAFEQRPQLGSDRMHARRELLASLDRSHAGLGTPAAARQIRRYYDKALRLFSSPQLHAAVDLSRESQATRESYGVYEPLVKPVGAGGAELAYARHMRGQNLLVARRLVEAGVPIVNVYDFRQQGQNWDAHLQCFQQHKDYLIPPADRALAALIDDLDQRGLLDTTLVVALGEFGRTPRINENAGRDHWPDCYCAVLAGGGVKGGFVYGASDAIGAYPALDPVTPADLAATIYWRFGIDPAMHIHDLTGRPFKLADGKPIVELFA